MRTYLLKFLGGRVFSDLAAKEVMEHTHVECLTPPSGSCDEQGFSSITEDVFDQEGFVNKNLFGYQACKISGTYVQAVVIQTSSLFLSCRITQVR